MNAAHFHPERTQMTDTGRQAGRQVGRQDMTTSPDSIETVLGMIAERRDVLTNLEAALLDVRRVFGPSFLVMRPDVIVADTPTAPLAVPASTSTVRRAKPPVNAPAPRIGLKQQGKLEDIGARALAFLGHQTRPVRFAQIAAGIGSSNKNLRAALNALVDAGKVVRRGIKAGQTIGLPTVMASSVPVSAKTNTTAPPAAPPAATSTDASQLRVAIWKVLKAGGSVEPREMLRAVRGSTPTATVADVLRELETMVSGGRVERIVISPTSTRYRSRFPVRAEA